MGILRILLLIELQRRHTHCLLGGRGAGGVAFSLINEIVNSVSDKYNEKMAIVTIMIIKIHFTKNVILYDEMDKIIDKK